MDANDPYITPTGSDSQDGAPLPRASISRFSATSTAANAQPVNLYGCSTTGTSTKRQQTTAAPVALFSKPKPKNPYHPAPRKNAAPDSKPFAERAVAQPPPSAAAQSYDTTLLSGAVTGSESAGRGGKRRKLAHSGDSSSNAGKNAEPPPRETSFVPVQGRRGGPTSQSSAASKPAASRPASSRTQQRKPGATNRKSASSGSTKKKAKNGKKGRKQKKPQVHHGKPWKFPKADAPRQAPAPTAAPPPAIPYGPSVLSPGDELVLTVVFRSVPGDEHLPELEGEGVPVHIKIEAGQDCYRGDEIPVLSNLPRRIMLELEEETGRLVIHVSTSEYDLCSTSFDGTSLPIQLDRDEYEYGDEVGEIVDAANETDNVRNELLENYGCRVDVPHVMKPTAAELLNAQQQGDTDKLNEYYYRMTDQYHAFTIMYRLLERAFCNYRKKNELHFLEQQVGRPESFSSFLSVARQLVASPRLTLSPFVHRRRRRRRKRPPKGGPRGRSRKIMAGSCSTSTPCSSGAPTPSRNRSTKITSRMCSRS